VWGVFFCLRGDRLKLIYIASPLRGDYNTNIKNAVEYCRLASEQNVLPLAPQIIFSQWCNDTVPELREQGLKLGLALLEKSDELWCMGKKISEGMRGEIAFAAEHGIPIYFVEYPHIPTLYPISADENHLLSKADCIGGNRQKNYENQLVVLRHENLKPEFRTPYNQIWLVTFDPIDLPSDIHGDEIHLCHPVDRDRMDVRRRDIWGVARPEALTYVRNTYPEFEAALLPEVEQEGEFCR